MPPRDVGGEWYVKVISPRLPWGASHPRAAEVGEALSVVFLSREFALEDAEYNKIVPNEFVIELHEVNYLRNYQPIEERVLKQWRIMMLDQLATTNSRQGRSIYQLSAPLRLEIQPVNDLKPTEVRILCRVQSPQANSTSTAEPGKPLPRTSLAAIPPCLEMLSGGQRWLIRSEIVTIGRDERCNIHLDLPHVQDKRLISGEHAYLHLKQGRYFIYDGSPDGKPSVNGTFVNGQSVLSGGYPLEDGDVIILAALDPSDPRQDSPGVAALRFREACT